MAQQFYGGICYTDLIEFLKSKKFKVVKNRNGKIYFNIQLWINDTQDEYGQHGTISLQLKEDIYKNEKKLPKEKRIKNIIGSLRKNDNQVTPEDFDDF